MRSCYKHISKRDRADKPWQAIVRGEYLGCFGDELAAAKAVAKHLGLKSHRALLRVGPKKAAPVHVPKRQHRYVYWHASNQAWSTQVGGDYIGTYEKYDDAVRAAVKASGLGESDLRIDPKAASKSLQGKRHHVAKHAAWFSYLCQAYQLTSGAGMAYPGDLEDMHRRASGKHAAIFQYPSLIVPMILAKFGPHRDCLQHAFAASKQPKNKDEASWARWTYDVLVASLHLLTKVSDEDMQPWIDGPGKQSTHHSGLAVYAHASLSILIACDGSVKRKASSVLSGPRSKRTEVLALNKDKRYFQVAAYSPLIEQKLIQVMKFGEALLEIHSPKCLKSWCQGMQDMHKKVRKAPGIPNATSYRYKWVVRGFWDFQLRRAGFPLGLPYEPDATVHGTNKTSLSFTARFSISSET